MRRSMHALTSTHGTAMLETAFCSECNSLDVRSAMRRAALGARDWDQDPLFKDCTDNEQLICANCGWSTGE